MVRKITKHKTQSTKLRVKTGDTVRVLRGKDRGKAGKVMAAMPKEGRVLVEKINMVFRHVKPRRGGEKGQRVKMAAPVPVSNVQIVCPSCKKGTRVGINRGGDTAARICKKCGGAI